MYNYIFVGLEVHKETITIATAKGYGEINLYGTIPNNSDKIAKYMRKLGPKEYIIACYEAGPCGYGIYRQLMSMGIKCIVAAPSLIPKRPGDKVKTDSRDAKRLVGLLRSNELTSVWVPDKETEALRDLLRSRTAAKADQLRSRNRISKFLLRNNKYPPQGVNPWTVKHREWLNRLEFEEDCQRMTLHEYIHALDERTARLERLEKFIEEQSTECMQEDFISALRGLKGVDYITAMTIAAEMGDPTRFPHPRQAMSYVGLTPSEYSSGKTKRQGGITKSGNSHLRRAIVEAAWHYRNPPRVSYALKRRQKGLSPQIKDISWRTQQRLNKRFFKLQGKGKSKQVAVVAVARELTAFIWELGQQVAEERKLEKEITA